MPTTAIASWGAGRVDPLEGEYEVLENINLVAGTYAAGTLIGEVTATPGTYKTYATGNVDGSQKPTHILQYAVRVDGSGNVAFGDQTAGEWGQTQKGAPAYTSGIFSCADLVGLDAGAVTACGRLLQGTVSAGRFILYGA